MSTRSLLAERAEIDATDRPSPGRKAERGARFPAPSTGTGWRGGVHGVGWGNFVAIMGRSRPEHLIAGAANAGAARSRAGAGRGGSSTRRVGARDRGAEARGRAARRVLLHVLQGDRR